MTHFGTLFYAPIEEYEQKGNFGAWTDIYALAATLYVLLIGKEKIPSQLSTVRKIEYLTNRKDPLPTPKQLNPKLSDGINKAILKGMAIEPSDRPQSIEKWISLLKLPVEESQNSQKILSKIDDHILIDSLQKKIIYPSRQKTKNYSPENINRLIAIGFQFDSADNIFREGLARVTINNKKGYINKNGQQIIPCQFDNAYIFGESGLAAVEKDGKWGYIDKNGKQIIPCRFDKIYGLSEGLAAVKKDGKWGYIDKNGKQVIPYEFDVCSHFREGLAAVGKDGKYGFINNDGKQVISCQFEYNQFDDRDYEDLFGYMFDPNDHFNIYFSEGLARVQKDGKFGYIFNPLSM